MNVMKELVYRFRGDYTTEHLIKLGMAVGSNFVRMKGTILDPSHCWLITIGDNVTLAPNVHILCHDASTKNALGYTKIGRVTIGNNVFVGAGSIILPGVSIGDGCIVGAGSVVTRSVPDGMVIAGNPARVIMNSDDYLRKEQAKMQDGPCYGAEYTLSGGITEEKKKKQKSELENRKGFVI